jgi:hypothetical protein
MCKKCVIFLIFLFFYVSHTTEAQSFYGWKRERNLTIGGGIGMAAYFGELNNPGDYFDNSLNTVFNVNYYFFDRLAVRGDLIWYRLQGDDRKANTSGRVNRNLHFRSDNIEFSTNLIIHLFSHNTKYYKRELFNPYIFAGLGLTYFNPKAELDGKWHSLRPLQTEGSENAYGPFTMVIPMGIGVKMRVIPQLNLGIELGYRITFTDYLDDVSTVYPNPDSFTNPIAAKLSDRRWELDLPPAREGGIRGNPDNKDGYMLLNLTAEYYIPSFQISKKRKMKKGSRRGPRRGARSR